MIHELFTERSVRLQRYSRFYFSKINSFEGVKFYPYRNPKSLFLIISLYTYSIYNGDLHENTNCRRYDSFFSDVNKRP
ncbi:hypothetical protein HanRHA438_Chr05g0206811 [Helianthus annuus]|nr:hypothetical protein HanIR_Chr05g0212911 [Helianthus annuus]KAJ0917516.1 hypothetical protein HanRHA438_Chr05g0206811 [Helianthus annuus]